MSGVKTEFSAFGHALPIGKPSPEDSVNIAIGASAVRTASALSASDGSYRFLPTDDCYVTFGNSSVDADTTHMVLIAGQEYYFVVGAGLYVSCIGFASYNSGVLSITPLERA